MLFARWGGQRAGPVGWLAGVVVAALAFGLTPDVLWVSQAKGLLLSMYVLVVLWPALLLYNIVRQAGGIDALADGLRRTIRDRGVLLLVVAWAFSGALEGLAGFGIPIAIVSPILVGLGIAPVAAVAAVAVGHAWAVTFGDMGVILQSLVAVTGIEPAVLAPAAAITLGVACLLCGLAAARILRQGTPWHVVVALALVMAIVQAGLALAGLTPLAALGAGLAGIGAGMVLGHAPREEWGSRGAEGRGSRAAEGRRMPALAPTLAVYGGLALLMTVLIGAPPVKAALDPIVWRVPFPEVSTLTGHMTPAGFGQTFRVFTHPGTSILLVALLSYAFYRRIGLSPSGCWPNALHATWRAAAPASVGIIAMVGLSALMEHCGMTLLLAQGLSALMGAAFPLVAPLVGILGAFATGSNTNSNVLFGPMQKSIADLLSIAPAALLAAQTAGGSLGSMIAPAKLIVGCSTVGLAGRDGDVLRITLPYGLLIGLAVGVVAWLMA